jgi:hypothetical protein
MYHRHKPVDLIYRLTNKGINISTEAKSKKRNQNSWSIRRHCCCVTCRSRVEVLVRVHVTYTEVRSARSNKCTTSFHINWIQLFIDHASICCHIIRAADSVVTYKQQLTNHLTKTKGWPSDLMWDGNCYPKSLPVSSKFLQSENMGSSPKGNMARPWNKAPYRYRGSKTSIQLHD